jgi:hypothetical protein
MGDNRETSIYEQVAAAFEAEGNENPEESAPAATEEPAHEDVPPAQETEPAQEETAPATVPAAPASAPVDSTAMLMAMIQQQNQQIAQMQAMIQN